MASYLVWKNNCRRIFSSAKTYMVMLAIPVCILFFVMISESLTGSKQAVQDYYGVITFANQSINDDSTTPMDVEIVERADREKREHGLVGMLMTVYMIASTIYASRMIRDKKCGAMERFLCAGYSCHGYISGYILSVFSVVFVQVATTVSFVFLLTDNWSCSLVAAMELIALITIFSTLYGCIIAIFSKTDLGANLLASSGAVILSLIGGTFMEIGQMPELLQRISIISPIRWINMLL